MEEDNESDYTDYSDSQKESVNKRPQMHANLPESVGRKKRNTEEQDSIVKN